MKMLRKLAPALSLLLLLCACAAAPAGPSSAGTVSPDPAPSDTAAPEPAALWPDLDSLRELVDWQADEYLSMDCATRSEAMERLALRAVYTDLTLEDGGQASMALFTVLHSAHVERTIVLLLDESGTPLDQLTLGAAGVEPLLLDDSHVLFLLTNSFSGMRSYSLLLLKAGAQGWVRQDLPESVGQEGAELYYSVSLDRVHVFKIAYHEGYPTAQPEYQYLCTLKWEGEELGGFQRMEIPADSSAPSA